eukprot:434891-Hanusia_phi.AAC.1
MPLGRRKCRRPSSPLVDHRPSPLRRTPGPGPGPALCGCRRGTVTGSDHWIMPASLSGWHAGVPRLRPAGGGRRRAFSDTVAARPVTDSGRRHSGPTEQPVDASGRRGRAPAAGTVTVQRFTRRPGGAS